MRATVRSGWASAVVAVATLVAATVAAGCTRDGSPRPDPTTAEPTGAVSVPPGSPSPLPVTATAQATGEPDLTAHIHDVRADSHGLAVLRFTVTNNGSQPFALDRALSDPNRDPVVGYDFFSCELAASGVTLTARDSRHHPLYRSDGEHRYCMNARWGGQLAGTAVEPEGGRTLFATYLLPDGVRAVTVEIPGFEPVPGVPVRR